MKAGAKYTAQEIINALGVDNFTVGEDLYPKDAVFGQLRIRISGITGIVNPDHVINIQPGTEKLEVVVGNEKYTLELE